MKTFTSQCNYKGRIVGLLIFCLLCAFMPAQAQDDSRYVSGVVMNRLTRAAVMGTVVEAYTMDGKKICSDKVSGSWNGGVLYSTYSLPLPDGTYRLRYLHPDYEPAEQEITVKYRKRESSIEVPIVKLKRKPKEQVLQAATVKATKVKFYTKKDTLVFNADAFATAEGSMLNVLIRQLPGVELKDDGRIYVNGRYVESLLLNGSDFFRSDRSIMLENLPSYMVKDIKVYERESDEMLRMMKRESGRKQLVMDVNLKKQYSIGWIANTEWGGGTEKRYLGRLFALRFTPQSRLALVGNMNNVNDSRKPGETGSWTPEKMPSGALATKMAALDYQVNDKDGRFHIDGDATVEHRDADNLTTTNQVNFLQGGNTYERSRSLTSSRDTRIETQHRFRFPLGKKPQFLDAKGGALEINPYFRYNRYKNKGGSVSGTFSDDPSKYVSDGLIDSLRGPLAGSLIRQYLINRDLSQTLGEGHSLNTGGNVSYYYAVPHTEDMLNIKFSGNYSDNEDRLFDQRQYDYLQSTSASTDYRNQFFNRPGHSYHYTGAIDYYYKPKEGLVVKAQYQFNRQYASNQRELYRLDKMTDGEWGAGTENPIGTLPSVTGWEEQTLDAANSFYSGQHTYEHQLAISGNWWHEYKEGHQWQMSMDIPVNYEKKKLAYHTGSGIYRPSRSGFLPGLGMELYYRVKRKYEYQLLYELSSSMPGLRDLIDIKDDSNPLWVSYGNPDLKNSQTHNIAAHAYYYFKKDRNRMLHLTGNYTAMRNAISRAYAYDRETGIRSSRPENINDNYQVAGKADFSTPLGKQKRWTLQSNADVTYLHSVDLTDTGDGLNPRSVVKSVFSTGDVRVDYQLEKYNIGARVKGTWGHATSNRADFELINTGDLTYGLTAQVKLPWDIQFNTDLNLYSRYGYNDPSMNTNDLVWNARVSKTFMKGTATVLLDGFDILRNLSNVTRTLNAQGRTEVYRNVIPSYFMLHAIYRLNIKPKKRPGDE